MFTAVKIHKVLHSLRVTVHPEHPLLSQLVAQPHVPDIHTLPNSTLGGWQPQAEFLSAQVQALIVGSPMDILLPLCPSLADPSVLPSVWVHNGYLQPPGIFPAATAGLPPAYCPTGP